MDYWEADAISSEWSRDFNYGSSTEKLRNWVNETHSNLPTKNQVGITMVKIMLYIIFLVLNDVVTVLQFSLESF